MYKIKVKTNKRFFLGWVDCIVQPAHKFHPAHGYHGHSGITTITKKGFGGINYALKLLNGEIERETPTGAPTIAGVEGGPASELEYWFEKI